MPINVNTVPTNKIVELRNLFNEKYEKEPPAEPFHPVDLDRIRNADIWCRLFLEMYNLDMSVAMEKLWTTCIWRQEIGANDLSENNLRKDYLNDGVIFTRNKDIDGKTLLIFKTKLHVKGTKDMNEVVRVLVYWIERIHRETNMDKITVFFDMAGTGLSSMDLDFVQRIIDTFKLYYPNSLNYILIFEMAWILNAAFKIIKGFLPPQALEILKMISKKDINTYIDKDNCLKSWGGNDNYEFHFVPEQKQQTPPTILKVNGVTPSSSTLPTTTTTTSLVIPNGISKQLNTSMPPLATTINPITPTMMGNGYDKKQVHFANSSLNKMPQMKDAEDHSPMDFKMLQVCPKDFIIFNKNESNESTLEMSSISGCPITFKIQTTSPEKFRVRPRSGALLPGENLTVNILLKPEHSLSETSRDKFLIMAVPIPANVDPTSAQALAEIWKHKPSNCPEVEQHRLCCYDKANEKSDIKSNIGCMPSFAAVGQADKQLGRKSQTEMSSYNVNIQKQLKYTQLLQLITLILVTILAVVMFYIWKRQSDIGSDNGRAAPHCPYSRN